MNDPRKSIIKNYQVFELSTTTARTNKVINVAGNSILFLQSPVNVGVRLHNIDNDLVNLKQYDSVIEKEGFTRFYITHSALAGGTIKFAVYTDENIYISVGGGANAGGGSATTIGHSSLALTLAATEYSVALTNNTRRLKLINTSVDAVFYVSTLSGDSANGIPIQPLSSHNIENIDLEGYSIYVQSDVASRTLYYMEFL
ncbi:MAG: hypothetical protein HN802_06075 [Candidatus Jacksonbacteria bacterium]|nr:hypothetical protein [Candidatus Jacksonbacteria bacterium]MBT7339232.1 hypothetical protein [Candidatus Jacksonbacteria bacterium]